MREFITDIMVEKALDYLRDSAENYARWKARMKYLESHRKSVRSSEVLNATGKTITENTHRGESSKAYNDILQEYEEAVYEFTLIDAMRKAAEIKIEVWRSISSANKRGNI